jgi:proteic killer suppression protein
MKIIFDDKTLAKCAIDAVFAVKKMGQLRAGRYGIRLRQIARAENFEHLRSLPGHFHDLVGNRAGQWACDLDQPYRLIFKSTLAGPVAQIIWKNAKVANILEIADYH